VLGAGRGVQAGEVETPAMAAEAGRETRRGAESDEESDGCNEAQDSARVRVRNTYIHIKPQGYTSRPPLLTTNKVYFRYIRDLISVITKKSVSVYSCNCYVLSFELRAELRCCTCTSKAYTFNHACLMPVAGYLVYVQFTRRYS